MLASSISKIDSIQVGYVLSSITTYGLVALAIIKLKNNTESKSLEQTSPTNHAKTKPTSELFRLRMYPLQEKLVQLMSDPVDARPLIEHSLGRKKFNNPYTTWRSYNITELPRWKLGWLPNDERAYNEELAAGIEAHQIDSLVKPEEYYHPKSCDSNQYKEPPMSGSVKATWLGHASVLIQFANGLNCLVDPVFSKRSSPSQWVGPSRNTSTPLTIKTLKRKGIDIHVVLISHNHHDHLDKNTIAEIRKYFPETQFVVPLETSRDIKAKRCTELNWWEDETFVINGMEVKISAVPAQHWTQRSAFDERKSLWAGYVIESANASCYFVGDTGYCRAFKDIGRKFPDITLALIPIGAYLPRWFMNPQHISPEEAVQVFKDLGCKNALGIHWLTFDLADDRGVGPVKELEYFKKMVKLADSDSTNDIDKFVVTPIGVTQEYG